MITWSLECLVAKLSGALRKMLRVELTAHLVCLMDKSTLLLSCVPNLNPEAEAAVLLRGLRHLQLNFIIGSWI